MNIHDYYYVKDSSHRKKSKHDRKERKQVSKKCEYVRLNHIIQGGFCYNGWCYFSRCDACDNFFGASNGKRLKGFNINPSEY